MALSPTEPNVLVLQNTVERIDITVQDATQDPAVIVDPFELKLQVFYLSGEQLWQDTWPGTPTRITRVSTGRFFVDFGNVVPNNETDCPKQWVFNWKITLVSGGEQTNVLQKVQVVSIRTASLIPDFRAMVDKSRKLVNPAENCFLGYTDSQLANWLYDGLTAINTYQPSLTFDLETYPLQFKSVLIDSALARAIQSQELFAIDTDVVNYSDQGTSFVIQHQPQLAAYANALFQRLDRQIPQMKLQLINPGSLHTQIGPSFRLQTVVSAAPDGAVFRGITFRT